MNSKTKLAFTIIPPAAFRELPWKNGKGVTRELAVGPTCYGETYDWRISRAVVDCDGPFSDFSGYDRVLIMLAGKGMDLFHDNGETHRFNRPYDKAEFAGDAGTQAILVNGAIQDFNIMTRQKKCTYSVDLPRGSGIHDLFIDASDFLVYAPEQDIAMKRPGNLEIRLPAGHLFHQKDITSPLSWQIRGGGAICIQIYSFKKRQD